MLCDNIPTEKHNLFFSKFYSIRSVCYLFVSNEISLKEAVNSPKVLREPRPHCVKLQKKLYFSVGKLSRMLSDIINNTLSMSVSKKEALLEDLHWWGMIGPKGCIADVLGLVFDAPNQLKDIIVCIHHLETKMEGK